ncbi:enoyl-CoA hydratase/isomerase family protein [Microvirga sp. P5_D2]|jgi:enoyl-CoA hydratase/carnithine racemase
MSNISIERDGSLAIVRMLREQKRNALNVALIEDMHDAALALRRERDLSVVILSGGPGGFSAGGDLNEPLQFNEDISIYDKRHYALLGTEMVRLWHALPQVTIAAVEKFAIGGGLTIAMACDFRVCSRSAYFWVPEVGLGSNYGWHSTPRLIALAGAAVTRRMILLGERIHAEEALGWGLIDRLVEDGEAESGAIDLSRTLLAQPRMALAVSKQNINSALDVLNDVSSHGDMEQVLLCREDHNQSRMRG